MLRSWVYTNIANLKSSSTFRKIRKQENTIVFQGDEKYEEKRVSNIYYQLYDLEQYKETKWGIC